MNLPKSGGHVIKKSLLKLASLTAVSSLWLAACAQAPTRSTPGASASER